MDKPASQSDSPKKLSVYEWIPPVAMVLLAIIHLAVAKPDGTLSRLSLFICLGLVPGSIWRLAGRSSWSIHRVCFALSLIAFVLINPKLRPDADTLHKMIRNWPWVVLGFLAAFTQPIWGALRAQRLFADSGVRISQLQTFKLSLCCTFFNMFLPGSTGGDAYRVFSIVKSYHGKLGAAIASITLDRFLGLPALILVVGIGMLLELDFFRSNPVLFGLAPFIGIAAVVSLVFVAYLAFAGKSSRKEAAAKQARSDNPEKKISRRIAARVTGWGKRLHDMVAANVKSRATLPLALMFSFLAHLVTIIACICFGIALEVSGIPPIRYLLIVPMAMAINAIPGAPGGVGQGELAMATLLDLAHPGAGNAQTGVMVMLLFRLSNIALGLAGGIVYAGGKSEAGSEGEFSPAMAARLEGRFTDGD